MNASPTRYTPLDKFVKNVLEQRERRRRRLYFPVPGEVIFSDAFKEIASTTAPIVYLQIVTRQPYPPTSKEIKRLKKAGQWPPKPVEFSFPLREARHHGLTEKALAKGLRELQRVGIVDIAHHGSALRGDFSRFVLSIRWRAWGKPEFDARPWPKARFVPDRDKGKTEQFIRHSRQESMRKLLDANIATIDPPIVAENATTPSPLVAETAMNSPQATPPLVAETAVIIDLLHGQIGRPDSKVRSKKPWQPPLPKIRENVVEILRQRPDPRADDPRFVHFLADQLQAVQLHRLDPGRVHRDLQAKHDLDDWTCDLLFTIATIDLDFMGTAN